MSSINMGSFCHQDEEHDPSPEFEEYLACAVCGDNGMAIHSIPLNIGDTDKAVHSTSAMRARFGSTRGR